MLYLKLHQLHGILYSTLPMSETFAVFRQMRLAAAMQWSCMVPRKVLLLCSPRELASPHLSQTDIVELPSGSDLPRQILPISMTFGMLPVPFAKSFSAAIKRKDWRWWVNGWRVQGSICTGVQPQLKQVLGSSLLQSGNLSSTILSTSTQDTRIHCIRTASMEKSHKKRNG